MAKPNYFEISNTLESLSSTLVLLNNSIEIQETNEQINSNLELLYTFSGFNEELTEEERDLFNYVSSGYIENNPGSDAYNANTFYPFDENNKSNSYVGVYYDENEIE